jgi:hypothetical protein
MVEPQGCSTWAAVAGAVLNETSVRRDCVLAPAGVRCAVSWWRYECVQGWRRMVVVAGMEECYAMSLERVFGVDLAWRRLLDPSSCSGPVRRATDCACHPIQSAPTLAPAPARLIAPLPSPDIASTCIRRVTCHGIKHAHCTRAHLVVRWWSKYSRAVDVMKAASTAQTPSILPLPAEVVAQIKSSIAIVSLTSVVLELFKNSLDARAAKIEATIDFARGACTVEDDGLGIAPCEFGEDGGLGKLYCM